MPICDNCQNEVPDDAEFCSKCGAKINAPSMDEPIENTNEKSDKIIFNNCTFKYD